MKSRLGIIGFLFAVVAVLTPYGELPAADDKNAEQAKPLKVFILSGQSNMQGHAKVSTIASMRLNAKTAPILEEMRDADGAAKVCEGVWISSIGSSEEERVGRLTAGYGADESGLKIGPEFTFGIYMGKQLKQPILIIKTSWGGKSLNTDFRSPGAGPYEFNAKQLENFEKQGKDLAAMKAQKAEATGHYYRLMMEHVDKVLADIGRIYPDYDPKVGHELAGFVWFQGWNDMVDQGTYPDRGQPGGYDLYSELMTKFIRDVRKDLSSPELPFVIGVIGVGGSTELYGPDQQRYKGIHQNVRDAMAAPAALAEFKGNVAAVLTENYWDHEFESLPVRAKSIKAEEKRLCEEGKLGREEQKAAIEKIYTETFTADELEVLRESVSNSGYHYMGSARVMAQIGKSFAEAMAEMTGGK